MMGEAKSMLHHDGAQTGQWRSVHRVALLIVFALLLVGCGGTSSPTRESSTATETEAVGETEAVSETLAVAETAPVSATEALTQTGAISTTEQAPIEVVAEPVEIAAVPTAVPQPLPFAVTLPPGFAIEVYAADVPNARSMSLSPNGTLFVGTRAGGSVYALVDHDGNYQADEVITLAQGLNMPNGVAFRDGSLYVAEVSRVLRYDNIEEDLRNPPEPVVVIDTFPTDNSHGWKFIAFGPDGMLYVPVGAPCNICDTDGTGYARIARMNPDGSGLETFAEGIRNTVGFDWHPETGELWFTDNGRDQLGDDLPPDELNHAPQPGLHFGYPYCHAGTTPDPEFGAQRDCAEFTAPAMPLGAHVAALGLQFYTGSMFPEEYHNQILIAEHGSWNSSVPVGYRLTLVRLEDGQAVSYEPFATGFLDASGRPLGRPVDLLVLPDGSLLVSDDHAGMIYRITYLGTE